MTKYELMRERQQKEFNKLPIFYAFTQKGLQTKMLEVGLQANDYDKIFAFGNGGYYKKSDSDIIYETLDRHRLELELSLQDEKFAYEAISYELYNNEYSYTHDPYYALATLGLSIEKVRKDEVLSRAFKRAIKQYEKLPSM